MPANLKAYVRDHPLKLDQEYFEEVQSKLPLGNGKRKAAADTTATDTASNSSNNSHRSRKQSRTAAVTEADADGADIDMADATTVTTADVNATACWVCCDRCNEWHETPASAHIQLSEKWYCEMNNWLPGKVVCKATAAAAAAAGSSVHASATVSAATAATVAAAVSSVQASAAASTTTATTEATAQPADTDDSAHDSTVADVSTERADSASEVFVYSVTGTRGVLKLSCNMQIDCEQLGDDNNSSDLDDDDSDIDEHDSDDDAENSANSDADDDAPVCTVVQCDKCSSTFASQARLAQHKCAGAQLMQDVGSCALRYLMQRLDDGSMIVTTRETHQLSSHIQQQPQTEQQPAVAPAAGTLTAGWAVRPPRGSVYGANYLNRFAAEIDGMFAAGNANSGVKMSAAQMLGELQRRHAGRYDLPSESDIGRRISKLSSDKKQAQDDDY
jgi:hypothetical protein